MRLWPAHPRGGSEGGERPGGAPTLERLPIVVRESHLPFPHAADETGDGFVLLRRFAPGPVGGLIGDLDGDVALPRRQCGTKQVRIRKGRSGISLQVTAGPGEAAARRRMGMFWRLIFWFRVERGIFSKAAASVWE